MVVKRLRHLIPTWQNALLALASAGLLTLAFPDFEFWFLAWFALVPLMWAVERQSHCVAACFTLGWLFGTTFFFGTCWWLTYAPIHYAAMPWPIAYFLIFIACLGAGIFPGIFALVLSLLIRRLGSWAFLAAPFVWVFSEFLRYWVTGNNWNALGYSQAFGNVEAAISSASVGGVYLVGFFMAIGSAFLTHALVIRSKWKRERQAGVKPDISLDERLVSYSFATVLQPLVGFILFVVDRKVWKYFRRPGQAPPLTRFALSLAFLIPIGFSIFMLFATTRTAWKPGIFSLGNTSAYVVAVQPNVPMSGLQQPDLERLRSRQVELAGTAFEDNLQKYIDENLRAEAKMTSEYSLNSEEYNAFFRQRYAEKPKLVILPESPMNFMYNDDREFQQFIGDFARRNNVSVLFNSAEPDLGTTKYFNSAVMVGPDGLEVSQYDKIYLLPFGEAVPPPLDNIVPGFVGNFAYGREYDLLPVGDAKAGVMICFESHFGALSREYVKNGADVIIEMTNDGYLGPTPVLRQHLANAVFRAVETNRPVLRVTNVGITAYITENGQVLDAAPTYQEATRVWTVLKSDGSQTFYVKYGDWFAWLCTIVTIALIAISFRRRRSEPPAVAGG